MASLAGVGEHFFGALEVADERDELFSRNFILDKPTQKPYDFLSEQH
jgi:hypothetical protein